MRPPALPLLLCAIALPVGAVTIGSHDSLNVTAAGCAATQLHGPSAGPKGFADAVLYASLYHLITDHVEARVTVRGAESSSAPFIHEAYAGYRLRGFSVQAGFLADRFGAADLYGTRRFGSPLFDTYTLWDTYGAGLRLSQRWGVLGLGGGVTLSNRESAAMHLTPSVATEHWSGRLLVGFRTYDALQQDNDLVLGAEAGMEYETLALHLLASYDRYFGYGHATNHTMKPGHALDASLELYANPFRQLEFTGLVRYQLYRKRYTHETTTGGAEALWLPFEWLGAGIGIDAVYEAALLTHAPRISVELRPMPKVAEVRVYGERRQTGDASPTYTMGGTVWLDF